MNDPGRDIWKVLSFADLNPAELYQILRLRSEVFVVEQDCVYLDQDNRDQEALHLFCWSEGKVLAYARLLKYAPDKEGLAIGRIVTHPSVRRTGYGRRLIHRGIRFLFREHPDSLVWISAQTYLDSYYRSFGFRPTGKEYLEDGIPHQEMVLSRENYMEEDEK